jgi:MscS family membrane protein
MLIHLLQQKFLGNTIENYLWFAGIFLAGLVFKNLISKLLSYLLFNVLRRYFKTIGVRQFVEMLEKPFSITLFLIFVYVACQHIHFPDEWRLASEKEFGVRMTLNILFQTILVGSITWTLLRTIDYVGLVLRERAARTESKMDDLFVPFFVSAVKAIAVIFSLLFILGTVFDLNVASIIAGLGIGGLAIALASKDTLENLLGSFLIFMDKPFVVGDLVRVGSLRGHIEEVGFRTTKIRTIEKTLVIVPNKKMMDAELENQTERTFFRHKFIIGLVYSTTADQIANIIKLIREALDEHPLIDVNPNVYFINFGDSALEIDVTYLVKSTNFNEFEQTKQDINFRIMQIVAEQGSSFAFPSTSVYIEKEASQ